MTNWPWKMTQVILELFSGPIRALRAQDKWPSRKTHFVHAVFWLVIFFGWVFLLVENPWCVVIQGDDGTFRKNKNIAKLAVDDDARPSSFFPPFFKKNFWRAVLFFEYSPKFCFLIIPKKLIPGSTCIVVYACKNIRNLLHKPFAMAYEYLSAVRTK